jgi:hypothetical protein
VDLEFRDLLGLSVVEQAEIRERQAHRWLPGLVRDVDLDELEGDRDFVPKRLLGLKGRLWRSGNRASRNAQSTQNQRENETADHPVDTLHGPPPMTVPPRFNDSNFYAICIHRTSSGKMPG